MNCILPGGIVANGATPNIPHPMTYKKINTKLSCLSNRIRNKLSPKIPIQNT